MGNTSNKDQWAVRERLLFIERLAWWRGVVNRGDLRELFGISAAQASSDLQAYQELSPEALAYNIRAKRYESRPEMRCVLHEPRLEEAVRLFLGEAVPLPQAADERRLVGAKVDRIVLPSRRASFEVERRVFLAVAGGRRLRIKYWSVSSSRGTRREIAPHALAHDGYRWHVRAWCFENEGYRDFVLSRIEEADWPGAAYQPPAVDQEWEREETLTLTANPALDDEQRKSIERDYGMRGGKLVLHVRAAMKEYLLAHLRIPMLDEKGKPRPQHLELLD